MSRYAENTSVSAEKSRAEIETTLRRYGATGFMSGWQDLQAQVGFMMKNRQVRFVLPMPDPKAKRETLPALGITVADNEALLERELEEELQQTSRGEKIMKEYNEFGKWKEAREGKT